MISQKLIQSWRCLWMRGNEKWHGDEIILCFLSLTSPDPKVAFICSHPGIFLSQSSLTQSTEINFQVESWLEVIQTWSCNLQFEVSKWMILIFCFPGVRICWLMAQNDDADVLITLQSSYLTFDEVFPPILDLVMTVANALALYFTVCECLLHIQCFCNSNSFCFVNTLE